MTDVKKMLQQEPITDKWEPRKLKLVKTFDCPVHPGTACHGLYFKVNSIYPHESYQKHSSEINLDIVQVQLGQGQVQSYVNNWSPMHFSQQESRLCIPLYHFCFTTSNFKRLGLLRMGKQDGFDNILTKQLHDVSTRFIREVGFAVHENVTGYEEDSCQCDFNLFLTCDIMCMCRIL